MNVRYFNFELSAMAISIFLVAIGDVRAFEISNIHNPIKGYLFYQNRNL